MSDYGSMHVYARGRIVHNSKSKNIYDSTLSLLVIMQLETIETTHKEKPQVSKRDRGRRVWSLTASEEIVLKQCTAHYFKLWGYDQKLSLKDIENPKTFVSSLEASGNGRIGHLTKSIFMDCDTDDLNDVVEPIPPELRRSFLSVYDMEVWLEGTSTNGEFISVERKDSNSSNKPDLKDIHPKLRRYNAGGLQRQFIFCLRNDLPDNLLLRFVTANKFKVVPTIEMGAKTLSWRGKLHPVDSWLVSGDAEPSLNNEKPQFVSAFKNGQVYVRGVDKKGCPICNIQVKIHYRQDCPDRDFERLVCVYIEWMRLMVSAFQDDVDTGTILFDMTDMSLKNLDLAFVKFAATAFNYKYPECINLIIIHNAPMVFYLFWKLIKSWVGPDLEARIKFTRTYQDLTEFINPDNIPKRLGGEDDYEYHYIEPTLENSAKKPIDSRHLDLREERKELLMLWVVVTVQWLEAQTSKDSLKYLKRKVKLGLALAKNYNKLDPYYRFRGICDRLGVLDKLKY